MKTKKIVTFILILISIITITKTVFGFDHIWQTGEDWITGSSSTESDTNYDKLEEVTNIIWGIGVFVVLIGGVILGIRFMLVGGIEERAEIKKQMMPYIVGTLIIFGALTIWKIVIEIMEGLGD